MGRITMSSTPSEASVWLKLGRTNLDTMVLTAHQMLRLRLELPGYQRSTPRSCRPPGRARAWPRRRSCGAPQAAAGRQEDPPADARALPALPANLPEPTGFTDGEGPVHIESSPPGAEVWLLIGFANTGVNFPTIAGRAYELRALADGYKPGYTSITADEWRDPKGDPRAPIDVAKKKQTVDKHIDLEVDPDAKPEKTDRPTGAKPRSDGGRAHAPRAMHDLGAGRGVPYPQAAARQAAVDAGAVPRRSGRRGHAQLELPNAVVIVIDGVVLKASPPIDGDGKAGKGDAGKTWLEVELIGFTEDVVARIRRMATGETDEPPAPEPAPPPPRTRTTGALSAMPGDELPADERALFHQLTGELRGCARSRSTRCSACRATPTPSRSGWAGWT